MSNGQTHGIEATKQAIGFIASAVKQAVEVDQNRDGKISLSEGLSLAIGLAPKFPGALSAFPNIKQEFGDLTAEEQQELVDYFEEEFDIPRHDDIEELIELALDTVVEMVGRYQRFREILAD